MPVSPCSWASFSWSLCQCLLGLGFFLVWVPLSPYFWASVFLSMSGFPHVQVPVSLYPLLASSYPCMGFFRFQFLLVLVTVSPHPHSSFFPVLMSVSPCLCASLPVSCHPYSGFFLFWFLLAPVSPVVSFFFSWASSSSPPLWSCFTQDTDWLP